MIDILNSYFVQHKSISIPGLGTLHQQREPAILDAGTGQFMPPVFTYRFDKFFDAPPKEFFHFVAGRKRIPEYEAIRLYNEFAAAFKSGIKMNDQAEWKGAGIFKMDPSGDILFEPLTKPFTLFLPLKAEEISRPMPAPAEAMTLQEEEQSAATETVVEEAADDIAKPAWWIYALALIAFAILVLSIHFYNKGFSWHALFNQQLVM